jgi:hypothetical protein
MCLSKCNWCLQLLSSALLACLNGLVTCCCCCCCSQYFPPGTVLKGVPNNLEFVASLVDALLAPQNP